MNTRQLFKFSHKLKQSVKELRFEYYLPYFGSFIQKSAHHTTSGHLGANGVF